MLNQDFITKLEDYIENNPYEDFWKSYHEMSRITGYDMKEIIVYIDRFSVIKMNSDGKYTTNKMYEKHTGWFRKLMDTYRGEIK